MLSHSPLSPPFITSTLYSVVLNMVLNCVTQWYSDVLRSTQHVTHWFLIWYSMWNSGKISFGTHWYSMLYSVWYSIWYSVKVLFITCKWLLSCQVKLWKYICPDRRTDGRTYGQTDPRTSTKWSRTPPNIVSTWVLNRITLISIPDKQTHWNQYSIRWRGL